MDLSYGAEYEAFRDEVGAFLAEHWPLRGDEAGLSRERQAALFRERAGERGYLFRNIPKRYGGSEQPPDVLRGQIIREEFGRARAPTEARGIGPSMLVPTLLERGEEWQREKWVRSTILGDTIWCQGYSEPGSGSDLASLKTRGELKGREWVVTGQKIWTSGAQRAHFMFALVRTEPEAPKHAGISYLLLDMNQPGIEVRPLRQITGGSTFNEVFLSEARTPRDWIVGKRGEGWIVSRTTLKHERNSIGSSVQTVRIFDSLVRLAREARRGGRPALEDPEIRQRLVQLEGMVRAHQYSGYRQLTRDARGQAVGILPLMNKLISTNIGSEVSRLALDLLEQDGLLAASEHPLAGAMPRGPEGWISQYMGSLGAAIAGGTANIQRNIIAERGLGLPRDQAADRSSR
ncbi:MAG: acyl-CoA dehydrogenase family protein [Myxococcota bacterium]